MEGIAYLFLGKLFLESGLHLSRTLQIRTERFLDNDSIDSILDVVVSFEMLSYVDEYGGREGHVEDAITNGGIFVRFLNLVERRFEIDKGGIVVVLTGDVGADLEEFGKLLLELRSRSFNVFGYSFVILLQAQKQSVMHRVDAGSSLDR